MIWATQMSNRIRPTMGGKETFDAMTRSAVGSRVFYEHRESPSLGQIRSSDPGLSVVAQTPHRPPGDGEAKIISTPTKHPIQAGY